MYFQGSPQQFGPGDALIERYGLMGYVPTPNFFGTPAGMLGIRGLGCGCSICSCGGYGVNGSGMGLFESGTDYTQWGMAEWAIVGLGAYVAFSVLFTTKSAARASVRKGKAVRKALRA